MKKYIILKGKISKMCFNNSRIDKVLSKIFPNYSRNCFKKWIKKKFISLNDNIVYFPKKKVFLKDKFYIKAKIKIKKNYPEKMFLDILYEDKYLFIINKPKNVVIHPGYGNYNNTILNGILFYFKKSKEIPRAGIIHRLDKNTTGLLIIAKTKKSYFLLVKMLKFRKIYREYRALVYGNLFGKGNINVPIGRHPFNRTKMSICITGKCAKTYYSVLENFSNFSFLKIHLHTGRTHQIRVHMLHINHPIFGDPVYKNNLFLLKKKYFFKKIKKFSRQALHSYKLKFLHPIKKKIIKIKAAIPEDFKKILLHLKFNNK